MAETVRTIEAMPEGWPEIPGTPPGTNQAAIWQRIEDWCSERWTPRQVTWLVQGDGEWSPPLTPATVVTVESWDRDWQAADLATPAWGGIALRGDSHRVTAIVGADNPPPPAVLEAARRLALYVAENEAEGSFFDMPRSASSFDANLDGVGSKSVRRSAQWLAQAIQNSGAADLLRRYRKAR